MQTLTLYKISDIDMRNFIIKLAALLLLLPAGCSKDNVSDQESKTDGLGISGVTIPAEIVAKNGDAVECWAKGIEKDDLINISSSSYSAEVAVSIVSESKFSFVIPDDLKSGAYNIVLKRGEKKKKLGATYIAIIIDGDVPDIKGKNVKGIVHVGGQPLQGVVVSDGCQVTVTDVNGFYYLDSDKGHGYVFISVPSGYECYRTGAIPVFFKHFTQPEKVTERIDFELKKSPDQTRHRMLVFGDMHLANRSNRDLLQFKDFIADVNELTGKTDVPVYALTLGDMTFDSFWYTNSYMFNNYVMDISQLENLAVFHTIGNHDHEMGKKGAYPVGDTETVVKYKAALGPTYYSFNIGNVHYVVLDNIYNTNDGTGATSYVDKVTDGQLEWLKKDLSHVSKSNTLVISSHAQYHSKSGSVSLDNYSAVTDCFRGFADVHLFTGHTHLVYNVIDNGIFEHNAGAVCATWWWTGHHSDIHIGQDGAPGGYTVVDFDGNTVKWQFKGTGKDTDFQFRCYDGNTVHITADKYIPGESSANKSKFNSYASDWQKERNDNSVYINVWNWDPEWKIEVTEAGKSLEVTQVKLRDPLHLIAYTAPSIGTPTFATSENLHFFKVTASGPSTALEIKVTDRFGNVYTETMTRPRPFSIGEYK